MGRRSKHSAAEKTSSASVPRGITLGVLAASAIASGGLALYSSATANAACAAVGGWGSVGDNSCSATGAGTFALALLPGSTAHAAGTDSIAIAIGINNKASTSLGTGNLALALGVGNTASSSIGDKNKNTALGINNTATSVGSAAVQSSGQSGGTTYTDTYAATGSNNTNTAFGIGNTASTVQADGNRITAGGINNFASIMGYASGTRDIIFDPGRAFVTVTSAPFGQNNNIWALGVGNRAAAIGNGNNLAAIGDSNSATAYGDPGRVEDRTNDYTGDGWTKTVSKTVTEAIGNNNNLISIGRGNITAAFYANNNTSIAAGRSSAATTQGSGRTDRVTVVTTASGASTTTTALGEATGEANRALAVGRRAIVSVNQGNRNDSRVFGSDNVATVNGSVGGVSDDGHVTPATGNRNKLRVFGRNSTATADHVNRRTITARGNNVTAP